MLLELPRWSLYKEDTISYMALLDTGKIYFIELSMTNSLTLLVCIILKQGLR